MTALEAAATNKEEVGTIIEQLTDIIAELNGLFDRRHEAIIAPDLLTDNTFVPDIDEAYLENQGE